MSIAAAHANSFVKEVAESGLVWCIRDDGGFPAPAIPSGERAMPFWSKESRAQTVITNAAAYQHFKTHKLSLEEFLASWLPGMERDGFLVGVNWSGKQATGYDMSPASIRARLEAATAK